MSDCHAAGTSLASPREGESIAPVVAIVGPPNSGKSTLFNRLTGMRQKVANFPGVTVEHHLGKAALPGGAEVDVIDLPGIYSLVPRSEDERVTHDVVKGLMPDVAKPEAILLILDCTNLGRHLVLAAPILALGLPTLVILNLADDLRARGGDVNPQLLAAQLGAPVALISAKGGEGVDRVWSFLEAVEAGEATGLRRPIQLPVLNDVPNCREWAGHVGRKGKYRAPAPPLWTRRLDGIFLHPVAGHLLGRSPDHGRDAERHHGLGRLDRSVASGRPCTLAHC